LDQSLEPDQAIESEETGPAFLLAVGNVRLIEDITNVGVMVRDLFSQGDIPVHQLQLSRLFGVVIVCSDQDRFFRNWI